MTETPDRPDMTFWTDPDTPPAPRWTGVALIFASACVVAALCVLVWRVW